MHNQRHLSLFINVSCYVRGERADDGTAAANFRSNKNNNYILI